MRVRPRRAPLASVVVTLLGCQPKPVEPPQPPAPAPPEPVEIEIDVETRAPAQVVEQPPPKPTATDFGGGGQRLRPARTTITTTAITPGEFRSMVNRVQDEQRFDLHERCVAPHHPNSATISGQLTLDYDIGTVARVVTATVESCDYAEPEICTCIRDRVLKWRFVPHVQNVQVTIRVESQPSHL